PPHELDPVAAQQLARPLDARWLRDSAAPEPAEPPLAVDARDRKPGSGRRGVRPGRAQKLETALARIARVRHGVDVPLVPGRKRLDRDRDADDRRRRSVDRLRRPAADRHQDVGPLEDAALAAALPRAAEAGAVERRDRIEADPERDRRAL